MYNVSLFKKCMVCELVWHTRYSIRHKQESKKVTAVKLADVADTDSVDSQEEQDASVDNTCYMKLASKLKDTCWLIYLTTTSSCSLGSATLQHIQFSALLLLNRYNSL